MKYFLYITIFALLAVFAFIYSPNTAPADSPSIVWVVDGDTLVLDNKEHVRLIGVNAPEKGEPYYKESTKFMIGLAKNKKARLEFDRDKRDKYGRLLAYVYIEDGRCLNVELLKAGMARVFNKFPFTRYSEFIKYENEAREKKLGIWKNW